MTRLFLATALVLQLSGLSAAAVVVCADRGMPMESCCCHHTAAADSRTPVAVPECPCKMAPDVPAPAAPMPATTLSSHNPLPVADLPVAAGVTGADHVTALLLHFCTTGDSSPPYLTAAHPRC